MFDPTSSHPSPELLQVFRSGTIDNPNEMDAISRHLDECPQCLQTLEAMTSDTLENLIQRAYGGPESASESNLDLSFLEPAQTPEELGRLGPYRVLKILGQGGMGMVFHAEDTQLERSVALKVIRPEAARKPEARGRFFREAKLAASIEHDHIVPVFQAGEVNGIPFIAMPYLKGMSLADYLKNKGALPLTEVLRIGREIALGLSVAHARGLIHRDIQPANLWIEPHHNNRIKILDFGLARILDQDKTKLTQSGIILGTPAFMSPEQAQAKPVGPACDLFALGVVMYRLATGRIPFEGDNVTSLLVAVVTHNPPAPHTINSEIPRPLSELIMQLLEKDEKKRPVSATYVADELFRLENLYKPDAPPIKKSRFGMGLIGMAFLAVLITLASVFYFQTKQGIVRVEINDDKIEASLTKTGIVIKKSDDASEIRLSPGEQSLKVKRGDFEFETNKFILKKGETVTLKVELLADNIQVTNKGEIIGQKELPKENPAKDPPLTKVDPPKKKDFPPPPRDYNREVAEWVLSVKGSVGVSVGGGYGYYGEKSNWTLTKEHFQVKSISLPKNVKLQNSDLEPLKHCTELNNLSISGSQISDEALKPIKECQNLYSLRLIDSKITDKGMIEIGKSAMLQSLYLNGTNVTDAGLETIGKLPNLNYLDLSGTDVTDEGVHHLFDLRRLDTLMIRNTKITNRGIENLKKALFKCQVIKTTTRDLASQTVFRLGGEIKVRPADGYTYTYRAAKGLEKFEGHWTLEGIRLPNNESLKDSDMVDFAGLKSLMSLELYRAKISEEGIKHIADMPSLTVLDLQEVPVLDTGLKHLKGLAKIYSLNLAKTGITDAGLNELVGMTEMENIDLSSNKITDEGLKKLVGFKKLKALSLEKTGVTQKGIDELQKALPQCKIIVDKETPKEAPAQKVTTEREVAEWVLKHGGTLSYGLNRTKITKLDQLEGNIQGIRTVTLDENPAITSADYAMFRLCRELGYIHIRGSIDDNGLKELVACEKLGILGLEKAKVTDAGFAHLAEMKELTGFFMRELSLTGECFAHIKKCAKLNSMRFYNCKIDEKKLVQLKEFQNLTVLELKNTLITDVGLEHLATNIKLANLNLLSSRTTDKGLVSIRKMRNLMILDLSDTLITDEGLENLSELTNLKELILRKTKVTEKGVAKLQKDLPTCSIFLTTTDSRAAKWATVLSGNPVVVEAGGKSYNARRWDEFPKEEYKLVAINLEGSEGFDDFWVLEIAGLQHLRTLYLNKTKLTVRGVQELGNFPSLEVLMLEKVPVTDEGVKALKTLTKLKNLNLCDTQITSIGLKELAGMTTLTKLDLSSNKITDSGLKELVKLTQLKTLDLQNTQVTGQGIIELKKVLPDCNIITDKELPKEANPPKKAFPKRATEREVAEWILSVGGSFENVHHRGSKITKIDQIKDNELRIQTVTLPDNPEIKAADYAKFRFCRDLEYFYITGSIDNEALKNLKPSAPFDGTNRIRWISLTKTKLTDEGFVHLKDFKELTFLTFADSTLTGEGFAHLKGCDKLSYLSLNNTKIDEKNLVHLKDCPILDSISFQKFPLTDIGIKHLCDCEKLTSLFLTDMPITDAHLRYMRKCKSVTKLGLSGTLITDEGLENFTELSKLTELHVRKTKVTEKGVEKLQKELPTCLILLTTTDAHAAKWIEAFRFGDMVFDVGGKRVQYRKNGEMPKDAYKLIGIDVSNSKGFDDRWVPEIAGLKHLVTLDLFKTGLTVKGVHELGNFPVLESLILEGVPVTDEGMKALKTLTKLKNLNLCDTQITNTGLKEIVGLNQLEKLNLSSNKINDDGLKILANFKQLKTLTISKTEVTEKGIAELKKALPECKIILE